MTKPRCKRRGPQTDVGNTSELDECVGNTRAVSAAARHVNDEAISIEVAHQVRVDRGVCAEAVLRVQEENVDLVRHLRSRSKVPGSDLLG